MKIKQITLSETIILMNEISFIIGKKGEFSADSLSDRINALIAKIEDETTYDAMAVFAEYCKFVAEKYSESDFREGLERYISVYGLELLDDFTKEKIVIEPKEELELLLNRVIKLIYIILPIKGQDRRTLLISTLSNYYRSFENVVNNYTSTINDIADALIYLYDNREEFFRNSYDFDSLWKEGVKDRLEELAKEHFLGEY